MIQLYKQSGSVLMNVEWGHKKVNQSILKPNLRSCKGHQTNSCGKLIFYSSSLLNSRFDGKRYELAELNKTEVILLSL